MCKLLKLLRSFFRVIYVTEIYVALKCLVALHTILVISITNYMILNSKYFNCVQLFEAN